ncbi:MAG: hypothetical protein O3A20_08775, partial [Planctomycetota bacterium]|nr:hypothetical protein [Planctomycetota bacterium]
AWQRRPLPEQGPDSVFAHVRAVMEDLLRQAGLTSGVETKVGSGGDATTWLHPAHALTWLHDDVCLGWSGRVDPRVTMEIDGERVAYGALLLDLETVLSATSRVTGARFRSPSRMPAIKVDVALAIPATIAYAEIEAALRQAGGKLLESLQLFDLYEGGSLAPGHRSLAFHAVLRALDRTLEDRDEQSFLERVKKAAEALGGQLRS